MCSKMSKNYCTLSLLCMLVIVTTHARYTDPREATLNVANNTFVVFDPSVSILDAENCLRHSATQQIPLIAKVATKFSRIFIQLSEFDLKENLQTSLSQSARAVAEYNKLFASSSGNKLEVWLAYRALEPDHSYNDTFLYHTDLARTIDILQSLAQESNDIFDGTVTTVLFPYQLLLNHIDNILSDVHSFKSLFWLSVHWGLLLEIDAFYKYSSFNPGIFVSKLQPNVIIASLQPYIEVTQMTTDISLNVQEIERTVGLHKLKSFGFFVTTADTDPVGHCNMQKLVKTWREANKWSRETNYTIILSKAFDTPTGRTVQRKTGGWWRLIENLNYNTCADYKFEEKALIARENDERNATNFKQLKKNITFGNDHVEIIFGMLNLTRAKNLQTFSEEQRNSFLRNLVANFQKLVLLLHDDSEHGTRALLYELQSLDLIRTRVEITTILAPNVLLKNVFKWPVQVSIKEIEQSVPVFYPVLSSVKNYVVPFYGNGSYGHGLKDTYMQGIDPSTYKFGYLFDISDCSSFLQNGQQKHLQLVGEIMNEYNAQLLYFYFEEHQQTILLGAERMFRQRTALMGQCKKLVQKWNLTRSIKLSFLMFHYPTSAEFYENKWEMATFIEYWKMLTDWAIFSNTSIVLNNMMDAERYFKETGQYKTELGWWRLRDGSEKDAESKDRDKGNYWISKIDDAILRFPDTAKVSPTGILNTIQVILIVISSVAILALVVLTAVFLNRRNQRDAVVTKEEIKYFYNGTDILQSEHGTVEAVYKLPYEKNLYEIPKDAFTIDAEGALGSGEFGMVCLGRIQKDNQLVKVAIKMVNPINIHKTTVKSFLSEIKVLAHIGKHEHITQLIGANTQDLKFGKVFIFLELCELGSLEKYLRKMKSSLESKMESKVREHTDYLDYRTERYLRMVAKEKASLDLSLTEDLLRWSHEICKAMAYLASKYVVHADLATRNVLLNGNREAKICDFGLSRRMYNYTNYVKQQQEPLPWKWMAPESLRRSEFSEKSDVWAYGVTMWEIFSLGDQPYPGLGWTFEFVDMLDAGLRMDEPKYDNSNMYWIIRECWSTNPQNRPTFADLLALLD